MGGPIAFALPVSSPILAIPTSGVAGDFAEDGDHVTFNALISEEILQQGANDVVLLVPRRSGSRQFETASLE